jgi:hypothetical protein
MQQERALVLSSCREPFSHESGFFNTLHRGSKGEAIDLVHADTDRSALVKLPANGTCTIWLYLMGNDKDTGKNVGFNLDLSIQ